MTLSLSDGEGDHSSSMSDQRAQVASCDDEVVLGVNEDDHFSKSLPEQETLMKERSSLCSNPKDFLHIEAMITQTQPRASYRNS